MVKAVATAYYRLLGRHHSLRNSKTEILPTFPSMKFEFVVNLRSAKQIDLTMPPQVLARAT